MSQTQYKNSLAREIKVLNERIDYKILHGLRYVDDSKKHKQLTSMLKKQEKQSMLSRLATLSLFF